MSGWVLSSCSALSVASCSTGKSTPKSGKYKTQKLSVVVNKYCYGSDKYNGHTIQKTDKYKDEIDFLLKQGYTEIYDHTNTTYVYLPYETIWSRTKDVEGYTYTGHYQDVHKMS